MSRIKGLKNHDGKKFKEFGVGKLWKKGDWLLCHVQNIKTNREDSVMQLTVGLSCLKVKRW